MTSNLKCFFFLISIVHIHGYRGPTFRSSIMEGNKPILRMPPENSAEQVDTSAEENSPKKLLNNEPFWMEELQTKIKQLVEKLGHKNAKPHIKKLVEETEDDNNVLLHVEVSRDGESEVQYKYQMRAFYDIPGTVDMTTMKHPIMTPPPDPKWLVDLKVFVKDLIGRYGKRRLDEFVTPVIKAIQKRHKVLIKDIDVDHYGEVYITYDKAAFRKPWSAKRSRKSKKQRERSKVSKGSDDSAEFQSGTEIPLDD